MKKILSLILALIITVATLNGITVSAEDVTSGKCGENATWQYYPNGTLYIGGTGEMYDYQGNSYVPWNSKTDSIKYIVIDDGITSIGRDAFIYCRALEDVQIGNTVKTIGDYAFFRCEILKEIVLPDSVVSIGNSAFSWCFALEDVTLSKNLETIGYEAFSYCTALEELGLPASVTTIGKKAFSSCDSLKNFAVSDDNPVYHNGWNSIIETATNTLVVGCMGSAISNGVEIIGESAFADCTYLKDIRIPGTVKTIEKDAFSNSGLESVIFIDGVETIGERAFADCYYLTEIVIPGTVKTIGSYAFSDCYDLADVVIGSGVTEIGDYAFYNGMALTSITIPKTVKKIGVNAFDQRRNNNCDIYYEGTEEEWNEIIIESGNEFLSEYCTVHFSHKALVTVYGSFTAFGDTSATAFELLKGSDVAYSTSVTGTRGDYSIENVESGDYTLRASKPGYSAREYEITITNYDFYHSVEILLYGDVTGEGTLGNADIMHLNRYVNNMSSVFDNDTDTRKAYRLKAANVTAIAGTDTVVNNADVIQINRYLNNMSSVFDRLV